MIGASRSRARRVSAALHASKTAAIQIGFAGDAIDDPEDGVVVALRHRRHQERQVERLAARDGLHARAKDFQPLVRYVLLRELEPPRRIREERKTVAMLDCHHTPIDHRVHPGEHIGFSHSGKVAISVRLLDTVMLPHSLCAATPQGHHERRPACATNQLIGYTEDGALLDVTERKRPTTPSRIQTKF
jgi:hypothetical protein